MNLLLDRDQKNAEVFSLIPLRIGSGVTFSLHATLELNEEEQALIQQYNFTKSALVVSDPIDDLKKSFRPAFLLGNIAFFLLWMMGTFTFALTSALLVTLVMTAVYFKTLREQIIVSELLGNGRKFRCDSIVELVKKEAYLQNVCGYLRQVLESAKHWDDREAIPIEPLNKDDAKLAVLKAA